MRSRNKWSIEWFFKHKARNKNNKVTLSIGEQIFKALMSFVQVETMANITRHCKLNEIFKYNRASQYWNSNCRSKARAHALKSFPSFKIPNFPSRPASLFRISHLVERWLIGRQGYGLSPVHLPAIFWPRAVIRKNSQWRDFHHHYSKFDGLPYMLDN